MPRINYYQHSPEPINKLSAISKQLSSSSLAPTLRLLVELRVSQVNGCVDCVDMHSKQARQAGESQQRLDSLPAWHESPFFDIREKAALAWAESLTLVAQTRAPDSDFAALKAHFSDQEIVDLTLTISIMNTWNRISTGFRNMPERS